MSRDGDMERTPDRFQGDEGMATRHNIWVQRQEMRQNFQRIETRLDDTFEEFRQQHLQA